MDEKIIALIKARQDEGLRLLQRQYAGLVHYIVGNILENPEDTEECVSDIYIKIWNSIESYSLQKGKFTTWLTVVARNTALNYLKYKQHRNHEELKEDAAGTSSLEEEVLRRERAEELKQAIATLSLEEQHLFYGSIITCKRRPKLPQSWE